MNNQSCLTPLIFDFDELAGAVFRDSPLVEKSSSTTFGAGVFYTLWSRDRGAAEEPAP